MEKETVKAQDLLKDYLNQSEHDQSDYVESTIAANSEACAALCCHECCACCRSY